MAAQRDPLMKKMKKTRSFFLGVLHVQAALFPFCFPMAVFSSCFLYCSRLLLLFLWLLGHLRYPVFLVIILGMPAVMCGTTISMPRFIECHSGLHCATAA